MTNTTKTLLIVVVAILMVLTLRQPLPPSPAGYVVRLILPLIGLMGAALLIPNYRFPEKRGIVWYRASRPAMGAYYSVPLPSTWQGWVIDISSAVLIAINSLAVYTYYTASILGELDIEGALIRLAPIVIIAAANLWIRNRFCDVNF